MKPAKTGDKKFFTEEISLSGPYPEGVNVPEYDEVFCTVLTLGRMTKKASSSFVCV